MQPVKLTATVQPFWVTFLIQSGMEALAAYIASTSLPAPTKAAAEKLIADANAFIALI